jgi:AAA+ ATPase superfamily predicted ATPase
VLPASKVRLLEIFVKRGDAGSPLYGREIVEVATRRFGREEAVDFFEKGFSQLQTNIKREQIESAVDTFDGVIGWLTYFGHEYAVTGWSDVRRILGEAILVAKEEINSFLSSRRSERYT